MSGALTTSIKGTPERLTSTRLYESPLGDGRCCNLATSSSKWTRLMPTRTCAATDVQVQAAVHGQGEVILGYLVALHQVGVWVVLPVELGVGRD